METEKMTFNFAPGTEKAEVTIREGQAIKLLDPIAPVKIDLKGVINAPSEFLRKRLSEVDQINQKRCHIIVDRENLSIKLIFNENDGYLKGIVEGELKQHPKFQEFGINSDKRWEPNELGQFFKMNRAFFADKKENMDLVTQLKNFVANVNSVVEREKSESGSFKDNYSGVVNANIPGMFKVQMPLFKGRPVEDIEVEFYATVNGREVFLQLYSPGANQVIEEIRDKAIDEELNIIRDLAPEIAIIEI